MAGRNGRCRSEKKRRDPKYALAMADADIDAKEVGAPKGELLTLSPDKAIESRLFRRHSFELDELLKKLGLKEAKIEHAKESFAEKVARWLTNPVVDSDSSVNRNSWV